MFRSLRNLSYELNISNALFACVRKAATGRLPDGPSLQDFLSSNALRTGMVSPSISIDPVQYYGITKNGMWKKV